MKDKKPVEELKSPKSKDVPREDFTEHLKKLKLPLILA